MGEVTIEQLTDRYQHLVPRTLLAVGRELGRELRDDDDLQQEGWIALHNAAASAVEKRDSGNPVRSFPTYAITTIRHAIREALERDKRQRSIPLRSGGYAEVVQWPESMRDSDGRKTSYDPEDRDTPSPYEAAAAKDEAEHRTRAVRAWLAEQGYDPDTTMQVLQGYEDCETWATLAKLYGKPGESVDTFSSRHRELFRRLRRQFTDTMQE